MSTTIYISKLNLTLSTEELTRLLSLVSPECRVRFGKFHFISDSIRTLYGELIARYAITEQLSIPNRSITIKRDDFGKPYAFNLPIHFNISHAGDYVLCASSSEEIGADIEKIFPIDLNIAKGFFSTKEYNYLISQDEIDRVSAFFDIWTLKESYLKWSGRGLSVPLNSFSFNIGNGIVTLDHELKTELYFKQFPIKDYKCSICSSDPCFPDKILPIQVETLVTKFNA